MCVQVVGDGEQAKWAAMFAKYQAAFPTEAAEFTRIMSGELPAGWVDALPRFTPADKGEATRRVSQMVLEKLV